MSSLTSPVWWKAAAFRALRTALVIAVPYAPTVLYDGDWLLLLSSASFGALTSFVTSLFGIAESEGTSVSWYWAVFERVVKTAAQSLLTAFGTATLFSEVDWSAVPALVGSAVLGSLLLAVLKQLPEAEQPLAAATETVIVNNYAGEPVQASVPVVAAASAEAVPVTAESASVVEEPPAHIHDEPFPVAETPPAPVPEPEYIPPAPVDSALPTVPEATPEEMAPEPQPEPPAEPQPPRGVPLR